MAAAWCQSRHWHASEVRPAPTDQQHRAGFSKKRDDMRQSVLSCASDLPARTQLMMKVLQVLMQVHSDCPNAIERPATHHTRQRPEKAMWASQDPAGRIELQTLSQASKESGTGWRCPTRRCNGSVCPSLTSNVNTPAGSVLVASMGNLLPPSCCPATAHVLSPPLWV